MYDVLILHDGAGAWPEELVRALEDAVATIGVSAERLRFVGELPADGDAPVVVVYLADRKSVV